MAPTRTRQARRLAIRIALAGLTAGAGACRSGESAAATCQLSALTVTPGNLALRVGESVAASASPIARGCAVSDLIPTWSSQDPSVASVTGGGVVTALSAGSTTVTAQVLGVTAAVPVTVTVPVATVAITPTAATVIAGETLQLTATPRDARGVALPGRTVTWASDAPTVATVSASGLVTALAPGGPVAITATSEGISAAATLAVTPPPRLQLSTTALVFSGLQGAGNPASQGVLLSNGGGGTLGALAAGPVAYGAGAAGWLQLSLPPAAASPTTTLTVQPTIAGLAPGVYTATIPVTASAASNSPLQVAVSLTIQATPVRTIVVTPATLLLTVGSKQSMTATARDSAGGIVTGRAITWSSANPAVAAVDAVTGLVTAASTGVAAIVATVDGVQGNAVVYTGTASPYDGSWHGSAGSGRTFTMTVQLGRVTALAINVGTPLGSPCPLVYTASPLTLISSNAFSFSTSGGVASASVSGTLLSSASAQGTYGTITFDKYPCPPNLLVTGQVTGGGWTASRP